MTLGNVNFVEHDKLGSIGEGHLVLAQWITLQFLENQVEITQGVTAWLQGRAIENMHQHAASLHVTEEFKA